MARPYIPLLALLAACGDRSVAFCPGFDQLRVTDPDGLATAEEVRLAEQALADFAAWTGAHSVCVDEVRFVESITWKDGLVGLYQGPNEAILLEHTEAYDYWGVYTTTVHELCHAYDVTEGFSPDETAPLFPAASSTAERDGAEAQVREAFALACEEGPLDWELPVVEALADRCGTAADRRIAFLEQRVYAGLESGPALGEQVALTAETVWADAPDGWLRFAAAGGGDDVWVLAVLDTLPRSARVGRLDAASRTVAFGAELPEQVVGDGEDVFLLPADEGGPVLVGADGLHRVGADGTLAALPGGGGLEVRGGALAGGVLWLQLGPAEAPTLVTVDVATAAFSVVALPDGWAEARPVQASAAGVVLSGERDGRPIVAVVDPQTGEWHSQAAPGWGGSPTRLGDGRFVVSWATATDLERLAWSYGLAVGADETWGLTPWACGEDPWGSLVGTRDDVWVFYGADGALELTRIVPG